MPKNYFENFQTPVLSSKNEIYIPKTNPSPVANSNKIKRYDKFKDVSRMKRSLPQQEELDIIKKKVKLEETVSLLSTQD